MITNSKLSNYGCSSFLNNLSNNNLPGNLKTSAALNNKNLSNENTMNTSMDKVLYSGKIGKSNMKNYTGTPITEVEIVPSSSREYTIDDAINYQYNKTFSINLNEIMNGSSQSFSLRAPESAVPKEFIKNLKENGIQETSFDANWIDFYTIGLNDDSSTYSHSVDYLASGYVSAKDSINNFLTGEEKNKALEKLSQEFNSTITNLADKISRKLGGFFGESGSTGETQKIYDSIVNAYNETVEKYTEFTKNNCDYAGLENSENQWLKKDNSYMASALRTAASLNSASEPTVKESSYYSLAELDTTQTMVNEIKEHTSNIEEYDSEEKIGLDLAMLSLKGEAFNKYSGVSASLITAVKNAINSYINSATEQLNAKLEKDREGIAEPEKMANLKKENIFSVYNKVMQTYNTSNDFFKSLQIGAAFGYQQHMDNAKNPQYSILNRYGKNGSIFWRNFYEQSLNSTSNKILTSDLSGTTSFGDSTLGSYDKKKTSIECIANDWNEFISKITNNEDAKMITNSFLRYA